ncbi:MAG TPA: hypothetical protein VFB34_08905 [Chloroflexota bacterium]|nr:hypothetical protein [Chloroflexota bacterium]
MHRRLIGVALVVLSLAVLGGSAVSFAAAPAKKTNKMVVTLKVSPAKDGTVKAMGKSCKSTCMLKVKAGTTLKITEKPAKKHKFQHWVINGSMMGKGTTESLKVTKKKNTVEAVYK